MREYEEKVCLASAESDANLAVDSDIATISSRCEEGLMKIMLPCHCPPNEFGGEVEKLSMLFQVCLTLSGKLI